MRMTSRRAFGHDRFLLVTRFYVNIFVCHDDRSVLEVSDVLLVLWWVSFILSTALVTRS